MSTGTNGKKLDKGPALFLAQPYNPRRDGWNSLEACARTAGGAGYTGLQLQLWESGLLDLAKAADDKGYCDSLHEVAANAGCPIVEVANHLHTNLVVTSHVYRPQFEEMFSQMPRGKISSKLQWTWGAEKVRQSIRATRNFGLDRMAAFSGGTLFPFVYKWPQQPDGLVYAAFRLLADQWGPLLDYADDHGVDICFELHPGMDLLSGAAFEYFLEMVNDHEHACLILDVSHWILMGMTMENILQYIRSYSQRIRMWHVKDARFDPTAKCGVYNFFGWQYGAGQFRSLGDGQVNYPAIFRLIRELGLDEVLRATLEWECVHKGIQQGIVEEGAPYIEACRKGEALPARTAPRPHQDTFDAFAGGKKPRINRRLISRMLGIPERDVRVKVA